MNIVSRFKFLVIEQLHDYQEGCATKFEKKNNKTQWKPPPNGMILGLQQRDKAAMLGVNTIELFLEELK